MMGVLGGAMKVIACIEDPVVIEHILKHLKQKASATLPEPIILLPPERTPPTGLLGCNPTADYSI
jgi:hypothetical protein